MSEHWRSVVGYEGLYEVSDLGRVRTVKTGLIRKLTQHSSGHLHLDLNNCGTKTVYVHVLVAEAFLEPKPDGKLCKHKNGKPWENTPDNLEWGTQGENMHDSVRHGTHYQASKIVCIRGHRLVEPNLRKSKGRQCRSCALASERVRVRGGDIKKLSDKKYAEIMGGGK